MYNPIRIQPETIIPVVTAAAKRWGFRIYDLEFSRREFDSWMNKANIGILRFKFDCPCGRIQVLEMENELEMYIFGQDWIKHELLRELQRHTDGEKDENH